MTKETLKEEVVELKEKTSKMDDKTMAAIATIPGVGLVIYFAMPEASDFVKYYAKQSIGILALAVINTFISFIGFALYFVFIGVFVTCFNFVFALVILGLWGLIFVKALNGEKYTVPMMSDFLDKIIK